MGKGKEQDWERALEECVVTSDAFDGRRGEVGKPRSEGFGSLGDLMDGVPTSREHSERRGGRRHAGSLDTVRSSGSHEPSGGSMGEFGDTVSDPQGQFETGRCKSMLEEIEDLLKFFRRLWEDVELPPGGGKARAIRRSFRVKVMESIAKELDLADKFPKGPRYRPDELRYAARLIDEDVRLRVRTVIDMGCITEAQAITRGDLVGALPPFLAEAMRTL